MATENRMENAPNAKCDRNVMRKIDACIRRCNPCFEAFKNMGEVIEEHKAKGKEAKDILILFLKNLFRNQRRFNSPTESEIAMVFTDPNGEPLFEKDIRVYNKVTTHDNIKLNILNSHLYPMTYAPLFLHGESGWNTELRLKSYMSKIGRYHFLNIK